MSLLLLFQHRPPLGVSHRFVYVVTPDGGSLLLVGWPLWVFGLDCCYRSTAVARKPGSDLHATSSTSVKQVTLVLLPGMDGTALMFEPFIAALGNAFNIVSVSYPATEGFQTYDKLQDVAVSALPTKGDMVVLGESFSGPIAICLATKIPDRIVGVVLCCTFLRNPRPGLRWLRSLLALPAPPPPLPVVHTVLFGRFATTKLQQMLRRVLTMVPPVVLRERLRAVLDVDVRAQAEALQIPVLYLKAVNDRLVPAEATVDTQRHCRSMMIQEFEAPHCLLQTVPEEAARAVKSFVKTAASV